MPESSLLAKVAYFLYYGATLPCNGVQRNKQRARAKKQNNFGVAQGQKNIVSGLAQRLLTEQF